MAKEKQIAVCRQHWTSFIVPGVICIFFLLLALVSPTIEDASFGYTIFLLCISILSAGYIFVSYKFTYIALTETKLVGHIGFIKSKSLTTPISKVQDIGLSNGLGGKIFGYHTITISNAGSAGTEFAFKRMAKAQKFVDAVQEELAKKN